MWTDPRMDADPHDPRFDADFAECGEKLTAARSFYAVLRSCSGRIGI
jgi:hypothetical protein